MKKRIVLMGYMASGKSTIARLLASKMQCEVVDLDKYIMQETGFSIPQIFENKGEIYFRKLESQLLNRLLAKKEKFILALGGGTPCYGDNLKTINNKASSIYLKLSINNIVKRLEAEKNHRPLVSHLNNEALNEFVAKHLFERQDFYNQAQLIIDTSGLTTEAIIAKIIKELKPNKP